MRWKLQAQNSNRLIILLILLLLILALAFIAEAHSHPTDAVPAIPETPPQGVLFVQTQWWVQRLISLLPGAIYNSLPAFLALAAIFLWLAPRFIRGLYDTRDMGEARSFLQRLVFGMSRLKPIIIVREGKIAVGSGSFFDRVGGPGFIIVYNDSAVVLERAGRLTRVLGPSVGFLEPYERIWEVIDLRPQRWLFTDHAMTKEGIPISCEVDVTFKIDDRVVGADGQVQEVSPVEIPDDFLRSKTFPEALDRVIAEEIEKGGISTPLPYTDQAVFNAATAIWVRIKQPDHQEQLRHWTGRVMISEVEGALRNILARYRLDWLLQPPQPDQKPPRQEILEQLRSKLENTLTVDNKIGAKVLNIALGKINVKDERISTQWIEAWNADWEQRSIETLAEGEAEVLSTLQTAQFRAQAEMVLTLTEAIRPVVSTQSEVSSHLIALRLFQALHWMAYDPFSQTFLPPEALRTLEALEKNVLGQTAEVSKTPSETSEGTEATLSDLYKSIRMLDTGSGV